MTFWDWVALGEWLLVPIFLTWGIIVQRRVTRRWKTWNAQMCEVHEKLDKVLTLLGNR